MQVEDGVTRNDRVRVTWEGGYLVDEEYSSGHTSYNSIDGKRYVAAGPQMTKLSVMNPQRVWVQSIDPEKIRERISGEFVNPDAVALQDALDKANAEIQRLRTNAEELNANYEASKVLWKKRHREQYWLDGAPLKYIATAIEEGEPEPDPIDW